MYSVCPWPAPPPPPPSVMLGAKTGTYPSEAHKMKHNVTHQNDNYLNNTCNNTTQQNEIPHNGALMAFCTATLSITRVSIRILIITRLRIALDASGCNIKMFKTVFF